MTPQFPRIFRWHVVRDVRRHKLLALLNVIAVALGVAVYVAIQVANYSAQRAFSAAVDTVAGKAHLEVRGAVTDSVLPLVAGHPDVAAATPVIEELATLPDFPGEYVRVLGVDPFTNSPFRTFQIVRGPEASFDLEPWLARPDAIALSEIFAERHGIKPGDRLRMLVNGERRELTVLFLIDLDDSPAAVAGGAQLAAMDIGWAQELFDLRGKLSSVGLILRDPARAETVAADLQKTLPAGVTVAPPRQRGVQIEKMLGSFQMNLTAMSMVSLLVGMFLIYNTIFASATRRRAEIGILRALGASRWEVRALFLGEAVLFGAAGIAVGAVSGVMLANALVGSVAKTVSSLYVLVSIQQPVVHPAHFALAAVYGLLSALAGAWIPANSAAGADPVASLRLGGRMEQTARTTPRWVVGGMASLLAAIGCSVLALAAGQAWLSFAAAFFVLLGFALFAPGATTLAGRALRGLRRAVLLRLAGENLARSAHRNAVTIAALAAAVAMMTGVSVMIFSFRGSVEAWVNRGMVADLFVAPAANEIIGLSEFVPDAAIAMLEKMPGVAAVDTYRAATATLHGEPVEIGVVRGADRRNLRFVNGGENRKMARFFSGANAVIVTESFARRFRVREGARLPLETPGGIVEFEVAGIYYDYTSDRGVILMDRSLFDRHWNEKGANSLAIYVEPAADPARIAEEFRRLWSAEGELLVLSNRALRERILTVFDQTFAVTYVLRAIAILVAVVGIFLSLTALVVERERDIGILRAIGASPRQVRDLFLGESALLGGIASVLGLAAGACLAMVLTWVVNKAFFGWTIELRFPGALFALTPLWIVAAALAAAWYPAMQASRVAVAEAVRAE